MTPGPAEEEEVGEAEEGAGRGRRADERGSRQGGSKASRACAGEERWLINRANAGRERAATRGNGQRSSDGAARDDVRWALAIEPRAPNGGWRKINRPVNQGDEDPGSGRGDAHAGRGGLVEDQRVSSGRANGRLISKGWSGLRRRSEGWVRHRWICDLGCAGRFDGGRLAAGDVSCRRGDARGDRPRRRGSREPVKGRVRSAD